MHKRYRLFLALCLALLLPSLAGGTEIVLRDTPVEVYFSPKGGAQEAVTRAISEARSSIFVQAYSFTSTPIAEALLRAHERGVGVEAVLDKSQRTERYTGATFLENAGIPVYIDDAHAIAHNKVMVIDDSTVITGSFNFTKGAEEKNAENLLIIRSPELARLYLDNYRRHTAHSEPYERGGKGAEGGKTRTGTVRERSKARMGGTGERE